LAAFCRDRTAIERVYYSHRLGTKPPFEQVSPETLIERLVRQELRKERVLKTVYRTEITLAMLDAEVQRINATTRAPDMLVEIKTALGNDPEKFAEAFAKPFLVERLLREKFENDDTLHAPERLKCERVRAQLLSATTNGASLAALLKQLKQSSPGAVTETLWQLGASPKDAQAPTADDLEIRRRFGENARIRAPQQSKNTDRKVYFQDLPPALRTVLGAQLRQPGDVSAVVETPGGFLLYLLREKSAEAWSVAVLSLPKRSYEEWLEEQTP